jgi:hypothetical protein
MKSGRIFQGRLWLTKGSFAMVTYHRQIHLESICLVFMMFLSPSRKISGFDLHEAATSADFQILPCGTLSAVLHSPLHSARD